MIAILCVVQSRCRSEFRCELADEEIMRYTRIQDMRRLVVVAALGATVAAGAAELERSPVEATTVAGEKVRLFPNGRWEFVDVGKATEARQIAAQYPENQTRPVAAQGGWLPGTRVIMPGDKDYNRGSLSSKGR